MSELIPESVEHDVRVHEGVTAEYRPESPELLGSTHPCYPPSTPGPNDAHRQTLTKAFAVAPEFPKLPGLIVIAYLDCGGMGHVYLAEQETPRRTVAVKIATSANRAGMVPRERFDREIQALAAISHPNIMPIYTAGDWHGFPYYAMRYMPGGPLSKQLERFVGQPKAGATLMRKVARGLQALHEAKIIHRDLKPHNILLDEHDEPVIADFGLAKWTDGESDLTVTASALGTKYYMPPEQTKGSKEEYGPASDIWSFGITFFELLTGTRPFREDLKPALYDQIRSSEPAIPDTLPVGLATIIRRCLEKSHLDRYPSAAALGEDLDRWLAGAPIDPPKPRPASKRRRPSKRTLIRATALVAVLALATGVTAGSLALWGNSSNKEDLTARLEAGETVTLIGATGLPEHPATLQPGSFTPLGTGAEGHALLSSAGIGAIELWREPIRRPVAFRGECAFLGNRREDHALVGVIFAHEEFQIDGRRKYSNLELVQRIVIIRRPGAPAEATETASLELVTWGDGIVRNRFALHVLERPWPNVGGDAATIHWRKFEARIDHPKLLASWEGIAFPPIQFGEIADPWFPRGTPLRPLEPARAGGLGITVQGCDAVFRDFVVSPTPP